MQERIELGDDPAGVHGTSINGTNSLTRTPTLTRARMALGRQ
jgi:hypothetical protein